MFYSEGGETLAQVAQSGGRCPSPGNIQGQAGRGCEQPDPGEDVPDHGGGLDWMAFEGPFQPKAFCDSMILLWKISNYYCFSLFLCNYKEDHVSGQLSEGSKSWKTFLTTLKQNASKKY